MKKIKKMVGGNEEEKGYRNVWRGIMER